MRRSRVGKGSYFAFRRTITIGAILIGFGHQVLLGESICDDIQAQGLSDIVSSVQLSADGTSIQLVMSHDNFVQFDADAQEYFQSCGCADTLEVLTSLNPAYDLINVWQGIRALIQEGIIHRQSTPIKEPDPKLRSVFSEGTEW